MFAINYSGGGSAIPGPYNNMADAAINGIQLGKPFYVGAGGLMEGYWEGAILIRTV